MLTPCEWIYGGRRWMAVNAGNILVGVRKSVSGKRVTFAELIFTSSVSPNLPGRLSSYREHPSIVQVWHSKKANEHQHYRYEFIGILFRSTYLGFEQSWQRHGRYLQNTNKNFQRMRWERALTVIWHDDDSTHPPNKSVQTIQCQNAHVIPWISRNSLLLRFARGKWPEISFVFIFISNTPLTTETQQTDLLFVVNSKWAFLPSSFILPICWSVLLLLLK